MVTVIPISLEPDAGDMMNGVIEVRGLLRIQGSLIEIEYQTSSDSVKFSHTQTVSFDLEDVARIDYRKGLFTSRLTFHTTTTKHFDTVPGAKGERLSIVFARKQRHDAARLAWDLQKTVEDRKLRHIIDNG